MNIKEFQKKLTQIVAFAKSSGNEISADKVKDFFENDGLDTIQLAKVHEYLAAGKIKVTGIPQPDSEEKAQAPREADPLDSDEEAYLNHYRETLDEIGDSEENMKVLYEKCMQNENEAYERVIRHFMPITVEIALAMHRKEIPLADMIAEGNVYLVMAIQNLTTVEDAGEQIEKGIREGIQHMIDTQIEQKRQDDTMVEKVRRLEAAIKELTDEDDKMEFSVDELSIFLDMSREEIEDVLRLAGEDK